MNKKTNTNNIAKNEDVEFSRELADKDDMEAMNRMQEADERAEKKKNKR
ncbi:MULTISPECIES: YfhD family protein [Paraliobacillus]|nr:MULTISPECIES: YfhD family protein [Paraliobacillus]